MSGSSPEAGHGKGRVSRGSATADQPLREKDWASCKSAAQQSSAGQCRPPSWSGLTDSEDDVEKTASGTAPLDTKLLTLLDCLGRRLHDRFDDLELRIDQLGDRIAAPSKNGIMQTMANSDADTLQATLRRMSRRSSICSDLSGGLLQHGDPPEMRTQRERPGAQRDGLRQLPEDGHCEERGESTHKAHQYSLRREWQMDTSLVNELEFPVAEWRSRASFDDFGDDTSEDRALRKKHWWILWPSARVRLLWDIVSMLLVGIDMAVIPVKMAFGPEQIVVSDGLYWPSLFFWTLDIPVTFLTGYYRKGRVETGLRAIAKHYLFTWFLLDLFIVCSSWVEVITIAETEGAVLGRMGKSLRFLRIIRSLRLLRLVKMRRLLQDIQVRITSEYTLIIITILELSILVLWTNHFVACVWFAIGAGEPIHNGSDEADSWVDYHGLRTLSVPYQYITALHWSLTQFTPASMEVTPRNFGERTFAVCVLFSGMVVFSSFVSSITTAMTQLRQLNSAVDRHFMILRRFLHARGIPADLTMRIMRCVEYRLKEQQGKIPESDVQLLKHLSKPLHMEVLSHVYAPILTKHPFFRRYAEAEPVAMQHVCLLALQSISLCTGDALFTEACKGEQMFFLQSGLLRYYVGGCAAPPAEGATAAEAAQAAFDEVIEEGEWFCEASLWSYWAHWGTMIAARMSEVLALDARAFATVTRVHRLVAGSSQRYGAAFAEALSAAAAAAGRVGDVAQLPAEAAAELARGAFARRDPTAPPGAPAAGGGGGLVGKFASRLQL